MKKFSALVALLLAATILKANNIQVSNISITQNTGQGYRLISFNCSWENSWRTYTNEANMDGAWIFVKFRKKTSNTWEHATFSSSNHVNPANGTIQSTGDGKGAWLYRANNGIDFSGNVNYTNAGIA